MLLKKMAAPCRIALGALAWLVFISAMHYRLNVENDFRKVVKMGYMPVVTNLACPLLDFASLETDGPRFKALKFSSFAEMAEALRNGDIQVAFIIAPLSIALRRQGEDVKAIYIGNRHESTLVADSSLGVDGLDGLEGKTVAVPMRYSGHNLSLLELIESRGMNGKIDVVEMNPPDMASALAAGALSAYFVGEPFAAQAVRSGRAKVVFYVEQVRPGFICNLMLVRADFIESDPETVQMLVAGAVRSGFWARKNPRKAAKIASMHWGQPVDLVEYALTVPENRIVYDRYMPKEDELRRMAVSMKRFGLTDSDDVSGLVEDRFAKNVSLDPVNDLADIFSPARSYDGFMAPK